MLKQMIPHRPNEEKVMDLQKDYHCARILWTIKSFRLVPSRVNDTRGQRSVKSSVGPIPRIKVNSSAQSVFSIQIFPTTSLLNCKCTPISCLEHVPRCWITITYHNFNFNASNDSRGLTSICRLSKWRTQGAFLNCASSCLINEKTKSS